MTTVVQRCTRSEWREAHDALQPVAFDVHAAITRAWADYFRPTAIKVPRSFPIAVEGALLWGLPVQRADVRGPEIVVQDEDRAALGPWRLP